MDIGIASVAAAITLDRDGRCTACRIALGAVSAIPLRATAAEEAVLGERLTPELTQRTGSLAAEAAQPISDIRGTADYRRAIIHVLTARVVAEATSRATMAGAR
jgi:CO/xanthine dehydrogenase FAD-binding subunit